jgi:hypothetical protein
VVVSCCIDYEFIKIALQKNNDSLTSLDFWIILTPIINELNDGHRSVSPNYDDLNIYMEKANSKGLLYLPFSVFIIDSVIYLREIYGINSTPIKPGSIIQSINGYPDSDILKKLLSYKSGVHLSPRYASLQGRQHCTFGSRIQRFRYNQRISR